MFIFPNFFLHLFIPETLAFLLIIENNENKQQQKS